MRAPRQHMRLLLPCALQASSEHSVCFAVPHSEAAAVVGALERKFKEAIARGHISRVDASRPCSVLAAVGQRMASTPGVSAALFSSLANVSHAQPAELTALLASPPCHKANARCHAPFKQHQSATGLHRQQVQSQSLSLLAQSQ